MRASGQGGSRVLGNNHGGGGFPYGSQNSAGVTCSNNIWRANNRTAASATPNSGDSSSALPIVAACVQSTPEVPSRPRSSALVMPTPRIDPITVCELEAGAPQYRGATFQESAALYSATAKEQP